MKPPVGEGRGARPILIPDITVARARPPGAGTGAHSRGTRFASEGTESSWGSKVQLRMTILDWSIRSESGTSLTKGTFRDTLAARRHPPVAC